MISEKSHHTEFFWSRKYFDQINSGLMSKQKEKHLKKILLFPELLNGSVPWY